MTHFTRQHVVEAARSLQGTPFVHQGRDPALGLDCSGLVLTALRQCGWVPLCPLTDRIDYPHNVDDDVLLRAMQAEGRNIPLEDVQPGDLCIFTWPAAQWPQHMGVVSQQRDNRVYMIHSSIVGRQHGVMEHALAGYWRSLLHSCWALHGIEG